MFDYSPENDDELELAVGQVIDFLKEVREWESSVRILFVCLFLERMLMSVLACNVLCRYCNKLYLISLL